MYVLVDIGGTCTRIAKSADLDSFDEPVIFPTKPEYERQLEHIRKVVRDMTTNSLDGIAVGMPGTQSHDHRSVFISGVHALNEWSNRPLADDIKQALGAPVSMQNDTALVGLGEAIYGAGKGANIVMYITVSTGVGSVRIVDGKLEKMCHGAETGGQYIAFEKGVTIEDLVSGTAIESRFKVNPVDLGKDHPVWLELARPLGFAVYNSILHWSPDRVVMGGSMLNDVGISVERVAEVVREINVKMPEVPPLVHAALGDFGGLWGGLALLRAKS